jgi:hypothetical protein
MPSANERASGASDETVREALQQSPLSDQKKVETSNAGVVQAMLPQPRLIASASLPTSMVVHPTKHPDDSGKVLDRRFPGELEESFDHALSRIIQSSQTGKASLTGKGILFGPARLNSRRTVAFNGFRRGSHDDKLERDRRYGTVYTVIEEPNGYLVRLEMPRQIPASALKTLWDQPREMPDYIYTIALEKNALTIRAGVPDETLRRLAYISTSFPADFLTRIEFRVPVQTFVHRMREKMLEIIVFKAANSS